MDSAAVSTLSIFICKSNFLCRFRDNTYIVSHEFQLVHKSFDVTSNDTSINPPLAEGQANPARRDTVTIPPGGSVTLRWIADNPGAVSRPLSPAASVTDPPTGAVPLPCKSRRIPLTLCSAHDQVDWHMSSGLAAVFIEAPEKMQESVSSVPQVFRDHCEYWNMPTEGNVVGKMSVTDLDGQPWGPFPLVMVSTLLNMSKPRTSDSSGMDAQGHRCTRWLYHYRVTRYRDDRVLRFERRQ